MSVVNTHNGRRAVNIAGERKGTWTAVALCERARGKNWRWLVRCDCGREKVVDTGNWKSGNGLRTCACQPKPPNYNQLPDGESSFNALFYGYVKRAEKRGLCWELTREQFQALTIQVCTYCGRPPSQVRNTTKPVPGYRYTGVDRIDPTAGYTVANTTPCCGLCNRAKSDLPTDEWKAHIRAMWERIDSW